MFKNSNTPTIPDEVSQKLQSSHLANDLITVNHVHERLERFQQIKIFKDKHSQSKNVLKDSLKETHILFETKTRLDSGQLNPASYEEPSSEVSIHTADMDISQEEYEMDKSLECGDLSEDAWLGFFRGYTILERNHTCVLNENNQCIELSVVDDKSVLEGYLHAGIRCFMVDLFLGTEVEKQNLISTLRECELKISTESGFPVKTCVFAMISPRLQYMGVMDPRNSTEKLVKGSKLVLTTNRKYSVCSNAYKIYVNAQFLLDDCKKGDFILVGPSIQLAITEVLGEELKCLVVESGSLSSRLPVRFPDHCNRTKVSLEEIEDIAFAREIGITVIVSYKPGSKQYLQELCDTFDLLRCENFKICTRLVLSEYEDQDIKDLEWIAECYDGFLVEPHIQQFNNCCAINEENSSKTQNALKLSPVCAKLLKKIYKLKKPIILNPSLIAERQLFVQPQYTPQIYFYPDKFLISKVSSNDAFSFFLLRNALTDEMPTIELSKQLFCDQSEVGDDTIARACAAASLGSQVKAIVICSAWPDMAIKLSHFRLKIPVLIVSATESFGDFVLLYHNLSFLHYQAPCELSYAAYVANAFMFSLNSLKARQILQDENKVLLVYATNNAIQLCDKFLIFKISKSYLTSNLENILFL